MAGGVLGQVAEDVPENGLQGGDGEGDQGARDLGVFDAQHGVVGPAAVGSPLSFDY